MHQHPIAPLLCHRLRQMTSLDPAVIDAILREILYYYGDTPDEYVGRRHSELQRDGMNNNRIFETIQQELSVHRFRSNELSLRQIRRIIYG